MNNTWTSNNNVDRQKEAKAWLKKGNSFRRKKEHKKAIECYDKALEIDPKYADAWDAKGCELYEMDRSDEAIPCYDKAIEIKPKTPRFWNNKGVAFESLDKIDEALLYYEKAIDVRSNYAFPWCNKGNLLDDQGKHDEAIECYEKAIQARQKYGYAWYLKGWALIELDKYEEALDCFNRAIEIDPKYENSWIGKGDALHYLDRIEEAIKCYDKAIDLNSDSYAWSSKGSALLNLEKYKEAFDCYNKYIDDVNPEDGSAWNGKGIALYYLGRKEYAVACYDKAIELDPEDSFSWSNKGVVLFDLGLYEKSLEHHNKSIDIVPEYSNAWDGKGKALQALGRSAEAEVAFARARELNGDEKPVVEPDPVPLPEIVQDIQSILERKGQVILYGPPGTGKTYWAERAAQEMAALDRYDMSFDRLSEGQRGSLLNGGDDSGAVRICCFHPAYGYEDFLEGYRPEETNGKMSFILRDGIFKKLCKDALLNPDSKFYLIIDEINRGDIPRIFGELMTILEKNKRGKRIILPVSGDQMQVPRNVYVIGTMNTADRSIALLDTALRRRFGFIEVMPDVSVLGDSVVKEIHLGEWLGAFNRRICENIGRDARNRQVGHSYLMEKGEPISSLSSFSQVVQDEIIPLLEEYCYEDYSTLEKILGRELVDVQRQMIRHEIFEDSREMRVMGAEVFVRAMSEISKDGFDLIPVLMQGSNVSEEIENDSCDDTERIDGDG